MKYTLRASQIPHWADCQARANHDRQRVGADSSRPPVALVAGSIVHYALAGQHYDMPDFIEWDEGTGNLKELNRQTARMVREARHQMREHGWEVCQHELAIEREFRVKMDELPGITTDTSVLVTGHVDAVLVHDRTGELASLELKTGIRPPQAAWLQSGVYALIWDGRDEPAINKSIVLWLHRSRPESLWEERDSGPLKNAAMGHVRRYADAMEYGPAYNPSSLSCRSCLNEECPVRYNRNYLPDEPIS